MRIFRRLMGQGDGMPKLAPRPSAAEVERERRQAESERAKQAAARARAQREREEGEQLAERARASQEEIERSCRTLGFWWPGESTPVGRFGQDRGGIMRIIRALRGE